MSFVCAEGVAASKLGLIVHEMVGRSEIRIAPRAAIASCLLNGRTLNTLQESLLVLAYAHIFLVLSAANFRGVVAGVLFSGFLSFLMGASSRARSLCLSRWCSLGLAVADLLVTACLAPMAPAAYLIAVGGLSLVILYLLHLDRSKREGMCLYPIKDLGILVLGLVKLAGWSSCHLNRAVVIGTTILLIGATGYHQVAGRQSLSAIKSAVTHRAKKAVSKPAARVKSKVESKGGSKTTSTTKTPSKTTPASSNSAPRRAAALKATAKPADSPPTKSAAKSTNPPTKPADKSDQPPAPPQRSIRAAARKARLDYQE